MLMWLYVVKKMTRLIKVNEDTRVTKPYCELLQNDKLNGPRYRGATSYSQFIFFKIEIIKHASATSPPLVYPEQDVLVFDRKS